MKRIDRFSSLVFPVTILTWWLPVLTLVSIGFLVVQPWLSPLKVMAANGEEERIDWSMGVIQATGIGIPPERFKSVPQARAMAKRAHMSLPLDVSWKSLKAFRSTRLPSSKILFWKVIL